MVNRFSKGVYTEELVERTIRWYFENEVAAFFRAYVATNFGDKGIVGLRGTARADYYGVFRGTYMEFEVKETRGKRFNLNNLKEHQLQALKEIDRFGGISFLLLHFYDHNSFFILFTPQLLQLISGGCKSLSLEVLEKNYHQLSLVFPGVIDWLSVL